jgi:hypothetical protein
MKIRTLVLTSTILALPAASFADADCDAIMLELKAGRTSQELINMYGLRDSDLRTCRQQADRDAWQARMRGDDSAPNGNTAEPEGSLNGTARQSNR